MILCLSYLGAGHLSIADCISIPTESEENLPR